MILIVIGNGFYVKIFLKKLKFKILYIDTKLSYENNEDKNIMRKFIMWGLRYIQVPIKSYTAHFLQGYTFSFDVFKMWITFYPPYFVVRYNSLCFHQVYWRSLEIIHLEIKSEWKTKFLQL